MDGELVGSEPSVILGGSDELPPKFYTYTEIFETHFPYYLSIGMTPEEFWKGDNDLVLHYRKSAEIKRDRDNLNAWLQGLYIQSAVAAVLGGSEQSKYPIEPFPLSEKQHREAEEREAKRIFEQKKAQMELFMLRQNEKFKKREVEQCQ